MADAYKAMWQYVHGKASDELSLRECQEFLRGSACIVFVNKADAAILNTLDPVIADGYFVCVPSEILNDLSWPAKRTFGIDDPVLFEKTFNKRLVIAALLTQLRYILCTEDFRECFYGKEIFVAPDLLFPVALRIHTPTGYYTVQMWMQTKLLPPGVQHSNHCQLHTCIVAKLIDRLPGSMEQGIVEELWLVQRKGMQLMWQGEDDMVIGAGQQFMCALLYPLLTAVPLALGTMPVATAVITDTDNTTLITGVYMPTEGWCATNPDGTEGAQLVCV